MATTKIFVDLDLRGNRIKNAGAPVDPTDLATKGYVDTVAASGGTAYFSEFKITPSMWVDNGDGSYSVEILTVNFTEGFGTILYRMPSVQLVKTSTNSDTGTSYTTGNVYLEPYVDASIEAKVEEDAANPGNFGVTAIKITINETPDSDFRALITFRPNE